MVDRLRPPKRTKVGAYTYRIKKEKGLATAAGVTGACGNDEQRILYDAKLGEATERDTILHEHLHAIVNQSPLEKAGLTDDLEEMVCRTFGSALLALGQDNPELVQYLWPGAVGEQVPCDRLHLAAKDQYGNPWDGV